ncbi:MAG TPA: NUDIX hydrolase, partial [Burkholderiales bacterium]|nr:NUDIX hydrolase [Burkholderiales bacterium]
AVIERDGRFLLVEEETASGLAINQPAGHLDEHESLLAGAARETLEETACTFRPEFLVGVYLWQSQEKELTYLRFAFGGTLLGHDPARALDTGIVRTLWLTPEELAAQAHRHRSPLVQRCVDDYRAGRRHSLDLLHHVA